MRSRTIDLDGPVHYADFGGTGPTLVLVHGLGGSHVNWLAVAPVLARRARVLAVDLAGFGRTPLGERSADVHTNRVLLDRFLDAVAAGSAVLVGNSMGGLLAMMEAALARAGGRARPGRARPAALRRGPGGRHGGGPLHAVRAAARRRARPALARSSPRPRGGRPRDARALLRRSLAHPARRRRGARRAGARAARAHAVGEPGLRAGGPLPDHPR